MMYQFLDTNLSSFGDAEVLEQPVQSDAQDLIDQAQINPEEKDGDDDNDRCSENLLAARPGDLLHFTSNVRVKLLGVLCPGFN